MLERIKSPEDLKKLNNEEMDILAGEIREFLVSSVADTGGHLASNLGVVELTMALHRVFDCPRDKIIWDVGHQSYVHKILTGRKEDFSMLRCYGGISGFPKTAESEYDAFNTGHSSTSVSAGLGLCRARDLKGEDFNVIAVIGDGSMTGGEAYEALNNAVGTKLIVVLNDNNMSISQNVGGMSKYLSRLTNREGYYRLKNKVEHALSCIPLIGKPVYKAVRYLKNKIRNLFFSGMFFSDLGLKYYGPIDGHDIKKLTAVFNQAKEKNKPCLIHVCTQKGKGYKFAEERPDKFHGISKFDVDTGEPLSGGKSFSSVFGKTMLNLAKENSRVCAVTAAMPEGTGLTEFSEKFPERFFDVGIAEQHAVTFSSALAMGGMIPYFAVYSTFLQRGFDQVLHDAALQNLHIVFAIDRAGLVGADGETHQGLYDFAYLKPIPNMTIMAPSDFAECESMLRMAKDLKGVVAVRYPRGGEALSLPESPLEYGKGRVLKEGKDAVIFAIGRMVSVALEASEILRGKGVEAAVCDMRFLKPVDREIVLKMNRKIAVSLEDAVSIGGLGEEIRGILGTDVIIKAFPDEVIGHGNDKILFKKYRLDAESIAEDVLNFGRQA